MATAAQLKARERNWAQFRIRGAKCAFATLTRIGTDEESGLGFEGMRLCSTILGLMKKRGRVKHER